MDQEELMKIIEANHERLKANQEKVKQERQRIKLMKTQVRSREEGFRLVVQQMSVTYMIIVVVVVNR